MYALAGCRFEEFQICKEEREQLILQFNFFYSPKFGQMNRNIIYLLIIILSFTFFNIIYRHFLLSQVKNCCETIFLTILINYYIFALFN